MEPTLIGYFPKRTMPCPDGLNAPHVREVCSVSGCISKGPANWIAHWKHNEMWVFDSPGLSLGIIPENERKAYDVYAYRVFPFSIVDGTQEAFAFPSIAPVPLTADFEPLGFDAVSRHGGANFGCSPLSCNYLANQVPTNAACLFDDFETAVTHAIEFEAEGCEPGPYFVVEVFRKKKAIDLAPAHATRP